MITVNDARIAHVLAESTPSGPWRWGDWSADFGTLENSEEMLWLEQNSTLGGDPEPCKRRRYENPTLLLKIEDEHDLTPPTKRFIAQSRTLVPQLVELILDLDRKLRAANAVVSLCRNCVVGQPAEEPYSNSTLWVDVPRNTLQLYLDRCPAPNGE